MLNAAAPGIFVSCDHRLVECEPGFRAIRFDESSDRMIIGSLGTWRGQAVQNSRLRLLEVRELQNRLRCPFAVHLAPCHRYGLHSPWQTAWFRTTFRLSHPGVFMGTFNSGLVPSCPALRHSESFACATVLVCSWAVHQFHN